jgi:hypothetical protein
VVTAVLPTLRGRAAPVAAQNGSKRVIPKNLGKLAQSRHPNRRQYAGLWCPKRVPYLCSFGWIPYPLQSTLMLSSSETKRRQWFQSTASRPGNRSGGLLRVQAIVRSANRAEDISGLRIRVNPFSQVDCRNSGGRR